MKRTFDTTAAAQGGAGVTLATALILLGVMFLLDLAESRLAWGVFLILCGLSFIIGMRWFGMKELSEEERD